MRRLVFVLLLLCAACVPANAASPTCGKPHKPPCPTTTTPTPTPTTTTPPPPPGNRIAVMLVNFAGDNRQPWTTSFIDSLYDGPPRSVADFYSQASWGAWTVTADVFGWFQTSAPSTGCNMTQISQDGDAAATASGVNLNLYSNRVYLFPTNPNCSFAGSAELNGTRVWINLSPATCTVANDCNQDFHEFVHEYGHNLGLNHAASYICTNGSGGHVVLSNLCTQNEYGDQFDVMGCCQPSLFSNVHRLQLGWIPPNQVVTVTTSQTLTVTGAYVQSSPIYRIPDGTGSYLYLENRAVTTIYDVGGGTPWANGNLLVRRAPDVISGFTQLLDGSPADNDAIPNAKNLPIGASFTTPGGITITNLGYDGTNNTVGVSVG